LSRVNPGAAALWKAADIVVKVRPPEPAEVKRTRAEQTVISSIYPAQNEKLLADLNAVGANVIAMDMVPRISRAQKMDVLSSMANIAGYRAVIEAGMSLGAITYAFDVRPEVAEQIESMGAEFVYLDFEEAAQDGAATGGYAAPSSPEFREKQLEKFRELAPEIDIVITTALIPGRDNCGLHRLPKSHGFAIFDAFCNEYSPYDG